MLLNKKDQSVGIKLIDATSKDVFYDQDDLLPCYWWDETANFGDWIGPWLISMKTGKIVVNSRGIGQVPNTVFSVGSVLHHLKDIEGTADVWGSGLIKPLDLRNSWKLKKKIKKVKFLGVRGRLTQAELQKRLGVKIPDVFGDPALLLPRYYQPKVKLKTRFSVCPHIHHYSDFRKVFNKHTDINVVDLKRDPRLVIDDIVNSDICISSSLHGMIIAQAYGIPWIWLRLEDKKLVGDKFKFLDFYSTLLNCPDDHLINMKRAHLSYDSIIQAASKAKKFHYSVDLNLLDQALV